MLSGYEGSQPTLSLTLPTDFDGVHIHIGNEVLVLSRGNHVQNAGSFIPTRIQQPLATR